MVEHSLDKSETTNVDIHSVGSQTSVGCGTNRIPKNTATYWSQIVVVYGIIIAAIAHLSLQSPDKELWLILLSSSLGYILPSPGLKFSKRKSNPVGLDEVDSKTK